MDCTDESPRIKRNNVADQTAGQKTAPPFHYLISEQAKSILALQELQNEVGALLDFRDVVIESFPHLRQKISPSSSGRWEPGVRVRRKLPLPSSLASSPIAGGGGSKAPSSNSGSAIQDSGFCAESNKDHSSASSSSRKCKEADEDDPLWNILDVIQEKGERLRTQVQFLRDNLHTELSPPASRRHSATQSCPHHRKCRSLDDLTQAPENSRLIAPGNCHLCARCLRTQRPEWIYSKQSSHSDGASELLSSPAPADNTKSIHSSSVELDRSMNDNLLLDLARGSSVNLAKAWSATERPRAVTDIAGGKLDGVISSPPTLDRPMPVVSFIGRDRIVAILKESDPAQLQRHLITVLHTNRNLSGQLEALLLSRESTSETLLKYKEEIEELKFQLEEKSIQLEGTRARVRMLDNLQKPKPVDNNNSVTGLKFLPSNPILPQLALPAVSPTRESYDNPSYSDNARSGTQSAEMYASNENKNQSLSAARKKQSKIPLKSNSAPKTSIKSSNNNLNKSARNVASKYSFNSKETSSNWNNSVNKSYKSEYRSDFGSRNWDSTKNSDVSITKCVKNRNNSRKNSEERALNNAAENNKNADGDFAARKYSNGCHSNSEHINLSTLPKKMSNAARLSPSKEKNRPNAEAKREFGKINAKVPKVASSTCHRRIFRQVNQLSILPELQESAESDDTTCQYFDSIESACANTKRK